MKKNLNITEADYIKFTEIAMKRLGNSSDHKKTFYIKNIILWTIIGMATMSAYKSKLVLSFDFHWPSVVIVSFIFIIFFAAFIYNWKAMRRRVVPNNNGLMIGPKTLEFTNEGIKDSTDLGTAFYKWEAVEDVLEDDGDIYIFVDKLLAHIIPAPAFVNEQERVEFLNYIDANRNN